MIATSPTRAPKSDPAVHQWVLVVMSDPDQQRVVRHLLEDAGFAVETAASIPAALRCLAVMKPSMVILDDELAGL